MKCKNCEKEKRIVNKFFSLCQDCNNLRLHGSNFLKQYDKNKEASKKSLFAPKMKEKDDTNMIKLDELFYEKCFNLSDHKCEECGEELPNLFRDDNGKILARWRYSHIVPKSLSKNLRHDENNINHLCLKHHIQWEFGKKESMKIYLKNSIKFPQYF